MKKNSLMYYDKSDYLRFNEIFTMPYSILITSPSLNPDDNVSGIANHTRLLISSNRDIDYTHLVVGRKDHEKRNLTWILRQTRLMANFFLLARRVDLVHLNIPLARFSLYINYALALICKLAKIKYIAHFRGGELNLNEKMSVLQLRIICFFLRNATRVIVQGNKEKFFYSKLSEQNFSPRIDPIPNAVKVNNLSNQSLKKRFLDNEFNLVYLGRIDFAKGLREIVDALEIHSNSFKFHLNIIGDGPDMNEFRKLLESKIKGSFTLHGKKSHDEIYDMMKYFQVFLLPSYFEGLPNAMLEAMANGVVPIVTPVGSIPEVVNEDNGFLVDVRSPESLAEAVGFAFYHRNQLYSKSLNCYESISSKYSIESYCIKLNSVYRCALSEN